ncbi:2Fe-2S iron-sulfur cluster-binding protein [Nocardia takedensis]
MPKVIYVGLDQVERAVNASPGETVMAAAVRTGVPGIIGDCGGNASCATCHVWIREEFRELVGMPEPGDLEDDMLDLGVSDRRDCSRLGCQVRITDELDGLTVDVRPQL